MLLCCITLSSSRENQPVLKRQQEGFLAPLLGSLRKSQHTKYPSQTLIPGITLFSIRLLFSSPPLHPCRFICPLSLYPPSICLVLPACFLFACVLVCLFVAMAQDTTKLCDFTNTNNKDLIGGTSITFRSSSLLSPNSLAQRPSY